MLSKVFARAKHAHTIALVPLLAVGAAAYGGPYSLSSNDPDNPFDPPLHASDSRFVAWATTVVDYSPTPQPNNFTNASNALGSPGGSANIVSLGDLTAEDLDNEVPPGMITLGFEMAIYNGPGHDFAVFENSFNFGGGVFGELAYIEVSSNGIDFARFPSVSLHDTPVPAFGAFDPTGVYNLAGKHIAMWGTPFDLSDLESDPLVAGGLVDLENIQFVRVVDIPGRGDFLDSLGNPIYDPWLTVGLGGFDLDAIGIVNGVEPELTITGLPLDEFGPWSVPFGPAPAQTITLTNTGSGPLSFVDDAVSFDVAGFDVRPRPSQLGSIAEGESIDLEILALPGVAGSISGLMTIETNAVNSPLVQVAVEAVGAAAQPVEWSRFAGSATGTGRQYLPNPIQLLESPYWSTGDEFLADSASVVVLPGDPDLVIAWGAQGDPFVKAFNADSGLVEWTSPPLSAGNTVAFGSWHTPAADAATNSIYIATGTTMYRLDGEDGSIIWDTEFDLDGSTDIVNGSVTVGGGLAFASTYGGVAASEKRLYAFDITDGSIAWSVKEGGQGSEAPVYVDNGLGELVFTLIDHGMNARNAADGSLVWSSTAPLDGDSWATTHSFFGGLSYYNGVLLAQSFNFGGISELVAVDAATGDLVWKNDSVMAGSGTPLVIDDMVYIVGDEGWGSPSYLGAYLLADGTEHFKVQLTSSSTMWNVSPVGFDDAIAVTLGSNDFFPSAATGLLLLDPDTGALLTASNSDSELARGTPAIGIDGRIYSLRDEGALAAYIPVRFEEALLADLDGSMGPGQTDDQTINVSIDAPFATGMRIAEGSVATEAWVPFESDFTFELSPGSGVKSLEIQVRNGSSQSAPQQFTIEYFEPTSVLGWELLHY